MMNSNDIKSIIGSNLKKLRKNRNLSQEKLAEFLEMDKDSVASIEKGRAFVSAESLSKLCNYFNVEPEYFLKTNPFEYTVDDIEVKKEINRILSGFNSENLQRVYKIVAALKT